MKLRTLALASARARRHDRHRRGSLEDALQRLRPARPLRRLDQRHHHPPGARSAPGDRLILTDEEVARLRAPRPAQRALGGPPTSDQGRRPAALRSGYQAHLRLQHLWIDPGTKVIRLDGKGRSSIIVEPTNGQLPLTKEAQAWASARQGNARVGNFDRP